MSPNADLLRPIFLEHPNEGSVVHRAVQAQHAVAVFHHRPDAGAFQPGVGDDFVGPFDAAADDRQSLGLAGVVVDALAVVLQVVDEFVDLGENRKLKLPNSIVG